MVSLTPDSRVVRSEEYITSTVDNELVMMSLEKGTYYGLDAIGSQIWENIAAPTTIDALCQKLVDEFDVDPAQCQADVLAFLNELHREGMIRALH